MKYYLLISILIINSSIFAQTNFELIGKVEGKESGTLMIMEYGARVGDPVQVQYENGSFIYSCKLHETMFYYIVDLDTSTYSISRPVELIAEPGISEIVLKVDNQNLDIEFVDPNPSNKLLDVFLKDKKSATEYIRNENDSLRNAYFLNDRDKMLFKLAETNIDNIFSLYLLYYHNESFSDLQVNSLLSNMEDDFSNSKYYKTVNSQFIGKGINYIGNQAYDFTLNDRFGNKVTLSKVVQKNRYVLLEFWGSWCIPCIKRAEPLKPLYEKHQNSDFEIVGLALETNRERWLKAIDREGYKWINLIELEGDKSQDYFVSKIYGVKSYPFNILIDSKMNIIGKDVSAAEVEEWLSK